jgi:predicted ATPase
VAAVWGLQDQGTGQLADRVADYLADRDLLLIIDNCEHVLAAAAGLIRTLLRAAPLLRVLATSREPLGAEGEVCWLVPSLGLPAGDAGLAVAEAAGADAVRLFAERAAQARPGFALTAGNAAAVSEICRRLDGIPLAIELAAARVRALTPQEIADRLDERFTLLSGGPRAVLPRHRTLRALTDWSWDLLTPPERTLCRRLAVFAGGFTLAAAEAVSGGPQAAGPPAAGAPPAGDVLAHVTALVEKSLLTAEPQGETTRYGMLDTIRQYAREQLAAAGEEHATRDRHLTWAAGLYEAAEAGLTGPGQEAWAATCGAELDNARAALAWALHTGRTGDGMRIASVSRLWQFLGLLTEGRDWLDRLLAGPAPGDPRRRAWAMNVVGYLACLQRDLPAARRFLEQALAQHTELGQPSEALRAFNSLVCVAFAEGNLTDVRRLLAPSPDWALRTGNSSERARTMMLTCRLAIKDGGIRLAEAVARESLATYQRTGDRHGMTSPLEFLGEIAYRRGDLRAARAHLEEGLALARAICKVCTQNLLAELAEVAAAQGGDPAEVTSLRAERDRLQVELGLPPRDPWTD